MDVQKLEKAIQGQVFTDEETVRQFRTDFGHIVERIPRAVVVPASARDVQQVVKIANQEGYIVSTRGGGHSQSGQSLNQGGILLDLGGLNEIQETGVSSVQTQSGVLWKDLVGETSKKGLIPPVLTSNLSVSVGGTLSMAGLGVSSHRYGTQADNVEELEVVTGEGHLVRCSPTQNRELFNCSRCGLGQFSIITEARLKLRKFSPRTRTYFLLYDQLEALLKDQERICREERGDYVECWCAPCAQGFRHVAGTKLPFAEWFYPMQMTVEYLEDPPREESLLAGLDFYRKIHVEDSFLLDFVNRLDPLFAQWKEQGTWRFAHPWIEAMLPWDQAALYIAGILKDFPSNLLTGGQVLMWPSRTATFGAPLFRYPEGELAMGFGILAALPKHLLPLVLPLLNRASDLCMQIGGKRYLSGWVEFDYRRWEAHFGETWHKILEWKRFYDPKAVLNPGFIRYERGNEK